VEQIGDIIKRVENFPQPTKPPKNTGDPADTEPIGKYSFGVADESHTFKNFKRVAGTTDVYKAFYDLAEGKAPPFLLVYGGVGNGKSHLVDAAALRLAERQIPSRVWIVPDFLSYLRRLIDDEIRGHMDAVIENYQAGKGAVFFDDFALEYGTPWEESIMERIICGRYRTKAVTVVTTNRDLDSIPERIVSRFYEPGMGKVILNRGKDYRKREANDD